MLPTPSKTFQKDGKWIEKPQTKSNILLCPSCGTKYLKTRKNQETCIRCLYK